MMPHNWASAIDAFATNLIASGRASSSVRLRRQHLSHLARSVLRGPWDMDSDDIAGYIAGRGWAQETRRSFRTSLSLFYTWAIATGRTGADPVSAIAPGRASIPNPRPVPDDVYLAALAQADRDEALWIDLAADHGLRRGEIARIAREDIVQTLLGHDLRVFGKGSKVREVPLTRAMAKALLDRVEAGYLWPGGEDGHISGQYVGIRVSRLLGGGWTTHKLRHRAATRFWVAAGGDPYVVADLMGWANLNMVRTYVKLPDERKRAVIEAAMFAR